MGKRDDGLIGMLGGLRARGPAAVPPEWTALLAELAVIPGVATADNAPPEPEPPPAPLPDSGERPAKTG